jgi:hypothetical protein
MDAAMIPDPPLPHGHAIDAVPAALFALAGLAAPSAGTLLQGVCAACAVVSCRIAWERLRWDREDRARRGEGPR